MAVRLRSLAVKGFRAYGATEQTLNLPAEIAAVWGPNSTGKTSLAEAFEWRCQTKTTRSPKIGHPAHLRLRKVRATRRGRRSD